MKHIWRRGLAMVLLACLTVGSIPSQALAVSTATEVQIGQQAARQVEQENALVTDPVLNSWVNSIGDNLSQFRARPDIKYRFKVIDTNSINAFSLPGGFVYLNFGLLNFVNSEDELAGVMGHEMGHVERRHSITLNAKAQVLNVLLGLLSIASPFVYRFGNMIDALSILKISRVDELQADQYGLLLMTRAGYDPNAMVSFMDRLGKEYGESGSALAKYFETHPGSRDRVTHMRGYAELSKTTNDQLLAQAIHDEDEGRFAYAQHKIAKVLAVDPTNQLALLHEGQVDLALGSFAGSHEALSKIAHDPHATAAADSAARHELALLPKTQAPGERLLNPKTQPLLDQLNSALANTKTTQTALETRVKLGKEDSKRLNERLDNLSYEIPNFSNVNIRPGSRLEGVVIDLSHMAKDINAVFDKGDYILASAPGMLKDDTGVLNEMQATVRRTAPSATDLELLPYYPDLLTQMNQSQNELVAALTASRGAMALAWQALPTLDSYFRQLARTSLDFGGDISPRTAQDLKPLAIAAETQLDAAANAAETAQTLYFTSQSRQLIGRITLLGVGTLEGRYATLQHVINKRIGVMPPSYDESVRLGMSAGDIAAASWLAAEEKVPVSTVINELRSTNKNVIQVAQDKHLSQESLEVVLGLWWEGYAEKPTD
ncbi:MAG: M48 family metallopeptidase [Candidatus Eremiobacteraeota bacterium]|nr:M48 family metallopeptidase [Candidatus Eremiobacteraeota bacterium]